MVPEPCSPHLIISRISASGTNYLQLANGIHIPDNLQYPRRDSKRRQRADRFAALSPEYHAPFSTYDKIIVNKPIEELVEEIQKGLLSPVEVLRAYGKVAVKAHEKTNCVTELLLPEAETWVESEVNLKGPLAGLPVSLKDSVQVKGFDITVGYAQFAGKPCKDDGPMVKLLKDAGSLIR